jgi:sulfite dehydrogenase (quinone) subunit SoeC
MDSLSKAPKPSAPEPCDPRPTLFLALGFITAGLMSSTLHLGHPERAWRATSQWRSSWLSREGVAAIITYVPAVLFGLAWLWFGSSNPLVVLFGIVSTLMAILTVYCTAMIYASLLPIHQWHNAWVVPNYLLLAFFSGALWLNALVHVLGRSNADRWNDRPRGRGRRASREAGLLELHR